MGHLHNVIDDDLHFIIDPDTRRIRRASEDPITLVQYDHNSERITFEIPKTIDGHDMTSCNRVRIHFLNIDANNADNKYSGMYESTDLDVIEDDDEKIMFTWLVAKASTNYAGPLSFAVSLQCTTEKIEPNGSTSTVIDYSWNTLPNMDDISVSNGMDSSNAIIEEYYDVVDTWLNSIYNMGETAKNEITSHANAVQRQVGIDIEDAGVKAIEKLEDFVYEVTEEITKQALADTNFVTQSTGTDISKVMSQDATTKAVENAKLFATSEASRIESSMNARIVEMNQVLETFGNRYVKKQYDNANTWMYYLDKDVKYKILHPEATNEYGFNIVIGSRYTITGIPFGGSTSTTSTITSPAIRFDSYGTTKNPDKPGEYQISLPYTKYDQECPCTDYSKYADGLEIRFVSYSLEYVYVDVASIVEYPGWYIKQKLIYEINGKPYCKEFPPDTTHNFASIQ